MSRHAIAILALIAACLSWACSFPLMKALFLHQAGATGHPEGWITNQSLLLRYVGGALILAIIAVWRSGRWPHRREWMQAGTCALASGFGLFLQIGALNHTAASTVGFLTQFYVVVLPVVAAVTARRWPSPIVLISVLSAFAGVAVLSGVTPQDLRPGTGELMTLGAAALFTLHILAVGAARWRDNDGLQVTWAMFALMAIGTLPVVACTGPGLAGIPACYPGIASLGVLAAVILLSTCLAYALMTAWQRFVSGTEAGVIYCSEALFTALLCLFLPAHLAVWLGVAYADEPVSWRMLVGGGLVLGGCLLVQYAPAPVSDQTGTPGGPNTA